MTKRAFIAGAVALIAIVVMSGCHGGSYQGLVEKPQGPFPTSQPSFVQAVSSDCNTTGTGAQCSSSLSVAISPKAGNTVLVPLWYNAGSNVSAVVTDSNHDYFELWASVPQDDLNNNKPALIYAAFDVKGGATTVQVTFGCGGGNCTAQSLIPSAALAGAVEYSGFTYNGTDASVTNQDLLTEQTQGQVINSGPFETQVKNEMAFGIAIAEFGVQAGSGWTPRVGCAPSAGDPVAGYFCFEDQPASAIGSFDATFVTDFASAGGLGSPPTQSSPNGFSIAAISVY